MNISVWQTDNMENLPIEMIDGDRSSKYPKRDEFAQVGVPFLNAESISSGKLDISKVNYITQEKFDTITKGRAQKGDVVLTMRGNGVGQAALFDLPITALINAQMLILRPDPEFIDPAYLFYLWSDPTFQRELSGYVSGSAQPQLTITHLKYVPITFPPIKEQRTIAHILGTLDDKIELNRRMNATLEAMARAIFKSWFVDFDPVHAKASGEQPFGMDAATAELFPGAFEESELGPIPAGWEVGQLDDLLVLQRGFDLPQSKRIPGPYPILAASGPSGTHNEYKVNGPGVTTGRSGVLGNVFFVHEDFWPLNTSLWQYLRQKMRVCRAFEVELLSTKTSDSNQAKAHDRHSSTFTMP
jgi:type I restriction enzyme S subunit